MNAKLLNQALEIVKHSLDITHEEVKKVVKDKDELTKRIKDKQHEVENLGTLLRESQQELQRRLADFAVIKTLMKEAIHAIEDIPDTKLSTTMNQKLDDLMIRMQTTLKKID